MELGDANPQSSRSRFPAQQTAASQPGKFERYKPAVPSVEIIQRRMSKPFPEVRSLFCNDAASGLE